MWSNIHLQIELRCVACVVWECSDGGVSGECSGHVEGFVMVPSNGYGEGRGKGCLEREKIKWLRARKERCGSDK